MYQIKYNICVKENLVRYRTCVCINNYHLVWSVKCRRKILNAEVEQYLKELVQQIADEKGFVVHLFERVERDHVHCFVSAPPKLSITNIVKYLKGITGRNLFEKFPRDQTGAVERTALEPLVLRGNDRLCIRREHPPLH